MRELIRAVSFMLFALLCVVISLAPIALVLYVLVHFITKLW